MKRSFANLNCKDWISFDDEEVDDTEMVSLFSATHDSFSANKHPK